jgi:hypothetical protein
MKRGIAMSTTFTRPEANDQADLHDRELTNNLCHNDRDRCPCDGEAGRHQEGTGDRVLPGCTGGLDPDVSLA